MNQSKFIEELNKINIFPTEKQLFQLEKYYELLIEYNKVMNLTGITDKEEVYLKHFYDSLTITKVIDLNAQSTLCDMGSGAGFPGIVLKIFFSDLNITLLDSLNKRIIFLNKVIKELKLENIIAIHTRIEEYGKNNREKFDVVTARALAPTNILLEYGIPILKINKYFIALKGNLKNENYLTSIKKLDVLEIQKEEFLLPIENSNRTIIVFKKNKKTSNKYPRSYKEIKNNPL